MRKKHLQVNACEEASVQVQYKAAMKATLH